MNARIKNKINTIVSESGISDAKGDSDTIRLWESYREQATMWRSIAVIQLPTTFIAVIFALVLWNTRSITLNVPAKPLPGLYLAQDIPDSEFIDVATDLLNLIATYQPAVARRQFQEARKLLVEPVLSKFDVEMFSTELRAIESTSRTQIFFVDPTKTEVIRDRPKEVIVRMEGERQKIIAGKEVEPVTTRFTLNLTTIPRNTLNPYGIVVTNILDEEVKSR